MKTIFRAHVKKSMKRADEIMSVEHRISRIPEKPFYFSA
jgi:hypothetical protein